MRKFFSLAVLFVPLFAIATSVGCDSGGENKVVADPNEAAKYDPPADVIAEEMKKAQGNAKESSN